MAVVEGPFPMLRRRWLTVVVTATASVLVWLLAREQITAVLRELAQAMVVLAGYETYDLRADALTIVVGAAADGALVRGTTLERWHVNLIVLPILVVAFGPSPWRRRLALGAAGLAVVLLCDALCAIAFVALQGWGATGEVAGGAGLDPEQRQTIRRLAMRGLAVYGSKLVPFVVWAGLYVGFASAGSRRGV